MAIIYKYWSMVLLFRAGFIHSGYHGYTLYGRLWYATHYTKRWIAAGAGNYRIKHRREWKWR